MAPSAIDPVPLLDGRDGQALEDLSDNIDAVNILKAELKEKDMLEKSQFDVEKDKTKFRQYEDACDRVKDFYQEQHKKQTVAYNLKARSDLNLKLARGCPSGKLWRNLTHLSTSQTLTRHCLKSSIFSNPLKQFGGTQSHGGCN